MPSLKRMSGGEAGGGAVTLRAQGHVTPTDSLLWKDLRTLFSCSEEQENPRY